MEYISTLRHLTIALAFLHAGCAQVPTASSQADTEAKQFRAVPGKAVIYVVRESYFGAAMPVRVVVDGRIAGATTARSYLRVVVEPGQRVLSTLEPSTSVVTLNTLPDNIYYVSLRLQFSVTQAGLNEMTVVERPIGQASVIRSNLVAGSM